MKHSEHQRWINSKQGLRKGKDLKQEGSLHMFCRYLVHLADLLLESFTGARFLNQFENVISRVPVPSRCSVGTSVYQCLHSLPLGRPLCDHRLWIAQMRKGIFVKDENFEGLL